MEERFESEQNNIEILAKEFDNINSFEEKTQDAISDVEKFLQGQSGEQIEEMKGALLKNTVKSLQSAVVINEKLQKIYNTFKTPENRRLEELDKVFSLDKYVFFLGGMDSEMIGIKNILEKENLLYYSKNLSWGAKVDNYDSEILRCISGGKTPVLIELEGDNNIPNSINIDHHGALSGNDPSIIQAVFGIIHRKEILLGVSDAEYIGGLIKKGATKEEIDALREMDRIAQGITEEQENEGIEAIKNMQRFDELNDLIIINMSHSKIATVTDRLFLDQYNKKGQNILILSSEKNEINYVVDSRPDLIKELESNFDGWSGGKEPNKYWGVNNEVNPNMPEQGEIVEFIKNYLSTEKIEKKD